MSSNLRVFLHVIVTPWPKGMLPKILWMLQVAHEPHFSQPYSMGSPLHELAFGLASTKKIPEEKNLQIFIISAATTTIIHEVVKK